MKISKIHIQNHFLLKDQDIDLTDKDGKPLEIVVFAGINGCGKTSLLNEIAKIFNSMYTNSNKIVLDDVKINNIDDLSQYVYQSNDDVIKEKVKEKVLEMKDKSYNNISVSNGKIDLRDFIRGHFQGIPLIVSVSFLLNKLIQIPIETSFNLNHINVSEYHSIKNQFDYSSFILLNNQIYGHIQTIISHYYLSILTSNKDITVREAEKQAFDNINDTFEILRDKISARLGLDIRISDIDFDNGGLKFSNSLSKDIDINYLSSGEKQLFIRTLILKMLNIHDSIIMIDEPELSMHPQWQRKIVDVYSKLGKNNQIIIATHSPLIIGSVYPYQIRVMEKDETGKVVITNGKEKIPYSKGALTDHILADIMGSEARYYKIEEDINKLRDKLRKKEIDKEFYELLDIVEDHIGSSDLEVKVIKIRAEEIEEEIEQNKIIESQTTISGIDEIAEELHEVIDAGSEKINK